MQMLAFNSSYRGVRLHTFEPDDDRVYTSTPTKIGGHCLDHVRMGLLQEQNNNSRHDRSYRTVACAFEAFDPQKRFGGLGSLVLNLNTSQGQPSRNSPLCGASHRETAFPLYPRLIGTSADGIPSAKERVSLYGPEWQTRYEAQSHHDSELDVLSTRALAPSSFTQRHTGVLLAVLLSKLANSNDAPRAATGSPHLESGQYHCSRSSQGSSKVTAVGAKVVQTPLLFPETSSSSRASSVRRDDHGALHDPGGCWAWNARLNLASSFSKLRRYSFIRELGRGSHGTALLVRKGTDRGTICVIKESFCLPEAVNEARLLLIASTGRSNSSKVDARSSSHEQCDGRHASKIEDIDMEDTRGHEFFDTDHDRVNSRACRDTIKDGLAGNAGRMHSRGSVVELHDVFAETLGHRTVVYLELEYCEGGSLHGLLRKTHDATMPWRSCLRDASNHTWCCGKMEERSITEVALGICEALHEGLHARGIVHRDLKPENILFTKGGSVRVADLGVSTSLRPSRPLTENPAGTIPFMAPEVRRFLLGSQVNYSNKADIWAVGALLYAMATENPAPPELNTASRAELASTIGHRTGSEALAAIALKALDADPDVRPSSREMVAMLKRHLLKMKQRDVDGARHANVRTRPPMTGIARL